MMQAQDATNFDGAEVVEEEAGASVTPGLRSSSFLRRTPRRPRRTPRMPEEAPTVPECAPVQRRVGPTAVITFRQAIELQPLQVNLGDPVEGIPFLEFGCVVVQGLRASLAVDLIFDQVWEFQESVVADLQVVFSLAPSEEITLELRNTQRKVMQQSVLDSVEEIESLEATLVDKEIVNVNRSSSRTDNWSVSGNGSVSLGGVVSLGASGNVSSTVANTASSSVQQVDESTRRSAESLKTLHKVEVKGTSEATIEEKVLRKLRNPYRDRTLDLSVFQLLKRYSVTTTVREARPALILEVTDLLMDRAFVLANGGFLSATLLDEELARELPVALGAVRRLPGSAREREAIVAARTALHYLFDEPNIFDTPDIFGVSSNDPALSYNGSLNLFGEAASGLVDAVANHAGAIFTTMNFFFRIWRDLPDSLRDAQAITIALALADGTKARWEALIGAEADNAAGVLDLNDFTDALRRLSGFLAVVDGMLRPLMQPLEHEREAAAAAERAEFVIARVVQHLGCYQNYYVQRFVAYLASSTNHITVARFVSDVIGRLPLSPAEEQMYRESFDQATAFLDRNEIVVQSPQSFTYEELVEILDGSQDGEAEVPSASAEVDVPFDGVHIEIAPGSCVLPDVPVPAAELDVEEVTVKGLAASVATPDRRGGD
jgi:hypothetical protein